jgi:hypothetical protein
VPARPSTEYASAALARPNIISRRCRWIMGTSRGFVVSCDFTSIEAQVAFGWQYTTISGARLTMPSRQGEMLPFQLSRQAFF